MAAAGPWAGFALTAAATFLIVVDGAIVVTAFPALRAGFSTASPEALSWVVNAYAIVYAALLVPAGRPS